MSTKRQAALGFIFVTLLIDTTGIGIIVPVVPRLIVELIHGDLSEASRYGGWLMFTYSAMQLLFSPVMGNLSDHFGRRPVLLASLFGLGVDFLVLALSPTVVWLFAARLFSGIFGASFTTGSAYIADISPPERRAQNFGMVGVAFGVGFMLGPVIGGVLGQYGSRVPFFAAAALSLINCLYGYFVLPESLKPENRRRFEWKRANPIGSLGRLRKYPVVAGLLGSLTFLYIAAFAVQSTWTYFTMERFNWDSAMVGYSLGLVGLLTAIVQGGLIRAVIPALGHKRAAYLGLSLYGVGFILFAFASQSWMIFAFLVPYCLGGIAGPALQGILSTQVPADEQGQLQGGVTSLMSLTAIISPVFMTHLFSYFTSQNAVVYFPGAPFLASALLIGLSLAFAVRTLSSHDHVPMAGQRSPHQNTHENPGN
jgi:DHA1 family tetracycline resistance protein-like MFS transporter